MTNRRIFVKQISAAGILSGMPNVLFSQQRKADDKIYKLIQIKIGREPYGRFNKAEFRYTKRLY